MSPDAIRSLALAGDFDGALHALHACVDALDAARAPRDAGDDTEDRRVAAAELRDGHVAAELRDGHGAAEATALAVLALELGEPDVAHRAAAASQAAGEALPPSLRLWLGAQSRPSPRRSSAAGSSGGDDVQDAAAAAERAPRGRGLDADAFALADPDLGAADFDEPDLGAADFDEPDLGAAGDLPPEPARADLARFVHLFGGREGVYARQWFDPSGERARVGYSPVHRPFTVDVARAHIDGAITAGTYGLRVDDTVTYIALDFDVPRRLADAATPSAFRAHLATVHAAAAEAQARMAQELGLQALLEDSGGKGRHLWLLLQTPVDGAVAHAFVVALVAWLRVPDGVHIEGFPKQARASAGGLGNLIKLPLGVHLKTGRRSVFLDGDQPVRDPWTLLRDAPRTSREALDAALETIRRSPPPPSPRRADAPANLNVERSTRPAPTWAELRTEPALRAVLEGCAVLDLLTRRAVSGQRVTHDERIVMVHTLGHLDAGPDVVAAALVHAPPATRHGLPKRALRGSPIACAGIRRRVPHVTCLVPCHCAFDPGDGYPTPLLHAPPPPLRERGPDDPELPATPLHDDGAGASPAAPADPAAPHDPPAAAAPAARAEGGR